MSIIVVNAVFPILLFSSPILTWDNNCMKKFKGLHSTVKEKPPFDPVLAHRLFYLAAGAYANYNGANVEEDTNKQKECIEQSGFPKEDEWSHVNVHTTGCAGGTCSFYAVKSQVENQLIFAFRGTNTFLQLFLQVYNGLYDGIAFPSFRNLYKTISLLEPERIVNPETKPWGKIHKYFSHAFYKIWPDVVRILINNPGYKVIFTGHSLGGALAALAAAQIRVEGWRESGQITLYTFGQPRIGDYNFAIAHSQQIPNSYRIVHGEDCVPHVGPCQKKETSIEFKNCLLESVKREQDGMPKSWKHCIAGGRKTFYHQGTEVWYKNGMSGDPNKDDNFVVCRGIPENEDINCSSGIPTEFSMAKSAKYMYDHVKYYGKMVSAFGNHGCDKNWNIAKNIVKNIVKKVKKLVKNGLNVEEEIIEEIKITDENVTKSDLEKGEELLKQMKETEEKGWLRK